MHLLLVTDVPAAPPCQIVAATLSLTGTSLGFTGALIRLIAASLSLGGSSVALPVADFRRNAARAQFSFATYGFGQVGSCFVGGTWRLWASWHVQQDQLRARHACLRPWSDCRLQVSVCAMLRVWCTATQQLYNDFNSLVQRDNLGTAARYIKQWNQLRSQLGEASMALSEAKGWRSGLGARVTTGLSLRQA